MRRVTAAPSLVFACDKGRLSGYGKSPASTSTKKVGKTMENQHL